MKKIEKLTDKQQKRLIEFRKEWLDKGLCCDPGNFDKAEEQITFLYEKLGKKKPMFFRFSSPYACEIARVYLEHIFDKLKTEKLGDQVWDQVGAQVWGQVGAQVWDQVGAQVWAQVGAQVRDQVGAQVWDQVWAQVGAQVRDQVGAQVRDQVGAQVWAQVWAQVRDQVWAQVWAQVRDQVGDQVWDQVGAQVGGAKFLNNALWGQHDANWIAFYKFFEEVLNVKIKDDDLKVLNAWGSLSESACWWAPWEGICIISDRPRFISFDDQKRLHNETKMAVEFSDGWGLYSWHGTRIPSEWITDKKSLTAKTALTWSNIEQRRAACEIIGWANILDELKAKVLDTDDDEQIGELVEVEIPDIGKEKFLRVLCSTGRKFALPMPPHIKTALEGNSWSYGIDGDTLKQLEIRT